MTSPRSSCAGTAARTSGVGGLVRAYGGALARALDGAPTVRGERAAEVLVRYGHEQTAAVMRCVHGNGGRDLDHAYGEQGVELRLLVPLARCDALAALPARRDARRRDAASASASR